MKFFNATYYYGSSYNTMKAVYHDRIQAANIQEASERAQRLRNGHALVVVSVAN